MANYNRYDQLMIESIGNGLATCHSASELAKNLKIDISGLIKHIKEYRQIKQTSANNKCGRKNSCHITCLCKTCYANKYRKDQKECSHCRRSNCNQSCSLFTLIPQCEKLKKFPYVCNGCKDSNYCYLNRFVYDPNEVWKNMTSKRSESRKGSHANEQEFKRLGELLIPLIKEKHQSLPQIFQTHKEEIRWSYPTILKFIDNGLIEGLKNIDLTKRVRYPIHYKKSNNEPTNTAFLANRTYDDFVSYISENRFIDVVEMDSVLSCKGVNTCLLTLLFRKSNFMLAFLLKEKTAKEVARVFEWIKKQIGIELYKKTFAVVLTDNGSEFADPNSIELDYENGEKICNMFYCDPGRSGQKGKIEKNHVELRKIFPKGCNFSEFSQKQINVALSNVNSEPRAILNRNCPGKIAKVFLDEKILALNEYQFVDPDMVILHPSLLNK